MGMTLDDIERMTDNTIDASVVAEIIGSRPSAILAQAHANPTLLGFPVIVHGSRVKIPREAFLYFMRYGRPAWMPVASRALEAERAAGFGEAEGR